MFYLANVTGGAIISPKTYYVYNTLILIMTEYTYVYMIHMVT